MSRYSTPLGSASASASASASESEYPASTRFGGIPSRSGRQRAGAHPLATGTPYNDDDSDGVGMNNGADDDEEEEAWDEVDIPQAAGPSSSQQPDSAGAGASTEQGQRQEGATAPGGGIEIVIGRTAAGAAKGKGKGKGKGETARDRMIRQERHKVHVMSLLAMGLIRNRLITPARYSNARDRSRLFDRALSDLTSWWYTAFEIVPDRELSRHDVSLVEQELEAWREEGARLRTKAQKRVDKEKERAQTDVKGKRKARDPPLDPEKIPLYPWQETPYLLTTQQRSAALERSASTSKLPLHPASGQLIRPFEPASATWEVIRPPPNEHLQTLNAAASNLRGSKDLSAQLYVALLRAIDIPARLVVSLQALEWRSKAQTTAAPSKARKRDGAPAKQGGRKKGSKGRPAAAKPGRAAPPRRQSATALDTTTDDDDDADFVAIDEEADRGRRRLARGAEATGSKPATPEGKGNPRKNGQSRAGSRAPRSDVSRDISASEKDKAKKAGSAKKAARKPAPDVVVLSSSASAATESDTDGSFEDGRGKLNYKVPKVKLRGSTAGAKVAAWKKEQQLRRGTSPDAFELSVAPTQWVEAYTRYNKEWLTVDPVRKRIRCAKLMEPPRGSARGGGAGNVMAYVVAYEEDGSARDVTPRYTRAFFNVTLKSRVPTSTRVRKANGGSDWFAGVIEPFGRGFKLNRDIEEEEQLWHRQANAPMPTSIGGFKNHPNYVLEQHLHRDEALRPGSKSLGLFKGEFPIFRRSEVVNVRSAENWYRTGRVVKLAEIPMKFVKQRAVTIHRRREEEVARMDGGEVDEQPLFAEEQTEVYVPPPVVDGKVPKNSFGNIDLFVPSMLPRGAVHLRSKYAIKCAKELGIDFGEAILGFEFRQRRALPVTLGIIVAEEHQDTLEAAIATLEQSTYERELAKQQDRVLKRWKKLIQGLRIRQRLLDQFKNPDDTPAKDSSKTTVSVAPKQAASATRKPTPPRNDNKTSAMPFEAPAKAGALAGPNEPRGRKRPTLPPSASDDAPELKRATRVQNGHGVTGLSTTGRSLRVRAPKAVEVKPEAAIAAPARPTRASAQKARSRLKPESDVDDEGSEDGGGATSVGAQDGEGGAQPQEAEDSEDGFEFDDDF
ncbi:hypothetical protein JCM8202v2_006062 [Rhodotorula sphaerocarpa]